MEDIKQPQSYFKLLLLLLLLLLKLRHRQRIARLTLLPPMMLL
jgi:hypothetical protein